MNLYIALLTDTFSRVYARALANAVMQQTHIILSIEKSLSKEKKIQFGHYMKNECGPLVGYNLCIQQKRLNYCTAQYIVIYFNHQRSKFAFQNIYFSLIRIWSQFALTHYNLRYREARSQAFVSGAAKLFWMNHVMQNLYGLFHISFHFHQTNSVLQGKVKLSRMFQKPRLSTTKISRDLLLASKIK